MEFVPNYKPVLKNEVPVYLQPMKALFKDYNIYVFGYGSLLFSRGWMRRSMWCPPGRKDLIECDLKGFERGPYGVYGSQAYYGIIRNARKHCNGVLAPVNDLRDWVGLMRTEMAAGITQYVNYRVVDVTDDICNITDAHKLKTPYKVHCVCNRPFNKTKLLQATPAGGYYGYVWDHVLLERSQGFVQTFLKTGGFRDWYEADKFINKEAGYDE